MNKTHDRVGAIAHIVSIAACIVLFVGPLPVFLTQGPDSINLDPPTRPLLGAGVAKYREAGAAERASDQTFAYLDALRTVIQQLVEGDVPADMAMSRHTSSASRPP